MLPDIRPGNTKILYFFNCLLDGMHTILFTESVSFAAQNKSLSFFYEFISTFWTGNLHLSLSFWNSEFLLANWAFEEAK